MAEMIFAIVLLLVTVACTIDGFSAISRAENVMQQLYGVGMLIIATTSFVGVILCTIASRIGALHKTIQSAAKDHELADKSREGVALERWETLCASLDKLEGATKKNKPFSNVGEDFDPTPDYGPAPAAELKAKCPKCGKTVKAKAEWAGRRGKCPGCGTSIQFPAATSDF